MYVVLLKASIVSPASRSQFRLAGKFFMPSPALISLPAGSALSLAHWKLITWGLRNTNMPLKQTVWSKPLKTAISCLTTVCVCRKSLQKRKRKWWESRNKRRRKWHGTSYPRTSCWWRCPGYWRPLRFAVLLYSESQMSFYICQNSTKKTKSSYYSLEVW